MTQMDLVLCLVQDFFVNITVAHIKKQLPKQLKALSVGFLTKSTQTTSMRTCAVMILGARRAGKVTAEPSQMGLLWRRKYGSKALAQTSAVKLEPKVTVYRLIRLGG